MKQAGGEWAVEGYLAEIVGRLPGPARTHSGIVAELRSGLLDAADAYRSAGLPSAEATAAAIGEFGDPGQVAEAFLPEIAAGHARRVVTALLVTGPLVGLLWLATIMASHLSIGGLGAGIHFVGAAVTVTACAGVAGIAVTGRLSRWLPAAPRHAPLAAAIAGFGAVGADGLGLVLLAAELAGAGGKVALLPAAAAAAASLARLLIASRAAGHCLAIRASLRLQ